MTELCESFHVLRGKPGVRPWDQYTFARWASGGEPTTAVSFAAAFVLSVWNGSTPADGGWWNDPPYNVGRFDIVEAMAYWDHSNKTAFFAWCENPFWP